MPNSNLWFISINTLKDCSDFSEWLLKKCRMFKDTMEFSEWIKAYKAFPLEIYMDGFHYTFRTRGEALLFLAGFEAALNGIK